MNIQLIQLISTKVLYAHFLLVFDDIQAQILLQMADFFFSFSFFKAFFVKIPLLNIGQLHCYFKTIISRFISFLYLYEARYPSQ